MIPFEFAQGETTSRQVAAATDALEQEIHDTYLAWLDEAGTRLNDTPERDRESELAALLLLLERVGAAIAQGRGRG